MGQPIAPASGVAFAFPDVCLTPAGPAGNVPVPYPNIAQLSDADPISDEGDKELLVGGEHVLLLGSEVSSTTGDEAGSASPNTEACEVVMASTTVLYGGKGIARFGDQTTQNGGNAVGQVLSANPTVLVGG